MENKPKRYYYSTVGYGMFSLLGEKYRSGRIEIFDREDGSGWAVEEGVYTIPHEIADRFEEFIESLETDLPIHIEIGSNQWCETACAEDMGFESPEDLRDPEKIAEYRNRE